MKKSVYVVSFDPDAKVSTVGGFDWFASVEVAIEHFGELRKSPLYAGDAITLGEVEAPAHLYGEGLTDYLSDLELPTEMVWSVRLAQNPA